MKEKQDSLIVRLLTSKIENSSDNRKKNEPCILGCAWSYSPSFIIRTEKTFV